MTRRRKIEAVHLVWFPNFFVPAVRTVPKTVFLAVWKAALFETVKRCWLYLQFIYGQSSWTKSELLWAKIMFMALDRVKKSLCVSQAAVRRLGAVAVLGYLWQEARNSVVEFSDPGDDEKMFGPKSYPTPEP